MNSPWDAHLRTRLSGWKSEGLSRSLRTVSGGVHLTVSGSPTLSFASNDYLGLASHPELIAAATRALSASGAGSRASPLVVGHRTEHAALEAQLAVFKQSESALVFPSGFQASLATLGALAGADDTILLDRLSHASLLDGAELSGARVRVFKHNDLDDLRVLLESECPRRCLIACESVYSMDGDVAPLTQLVALAESSGALLLVDEAHATGVLGPRGRGALETLGTALPPHVIALGTLSKALGSQGGYICARSLVTDSVVHAGRAYLYSTALAPAAAAAASAALELIDREPERRVKVLRLAAHVRTQLAQVGFTVPPSDVPTPIIPVIVGDESRAVEWSKRLLEKGLLVPAIRFPTVKKGQSRLRVSLSAEHSDADIARLLVELKALLPT